MDTVDFQFQDTGPITRLRGMDIMGPGRGQGHRTPTEPQPQVQPQAADPRSNPTLQQPIPSLSQNPAPIHAVTLRQMSDEATERLCQELRVIRWLLVVFIILFIGTLAVFGVIGITISHDISQLTSNFPFPTGN
jgi:hypothetical protein